jgi:TonB family protein
MQRLRLPLFALQGRISGVVSIAGIIDASGKVEDAEVLNGHPILRASALAAARRWTFSRAPAQSRKFSLRFSFVILPETTESEGDVIFLPPNSIEVSKRLFPPTINYSGRSP